MNKWTIENILCAAKPRSRHRFFYEKAVAEEGLSQNEARRHPKWENGPPRVAKGSQRVPKWAKRSPKGSQRESKGSQREPKGSQKGAKERPKCIQKSMFGKGREKVAKRVSTSIWNGSLLGAIFHQKCDKKSMQKSVPKKHGTSWKFNQKSSQNRGRNVSKSLIFLYSSFSGNNDYRWTVCKKSRYFLPRTMHNKSRNTEIFE